MAAAQEGRMNDIMFLSLVMTALCDAAGLGVQQASRHPQHEAVRYFWANQTCFFVRPFCNFSFSPQRAFGGVIPPQEDVCVR